MKNNLKIVIRGKFNVLLNPYFKVEPVFGYNGVVEFIPQPFHKKLRVEAFKIYEATTEETDMGDCTYLCLTFKKKSKKYVVLYTSYEDFLEKWDILDRRLLREKTGYYI